jgi:hypothetical protein
MAAILPLNNAPINETNNEIYLTRSPSMWSGALWFLNCSSRCWRRRWISESMLTSYSLYWSAKQIATSYTHQSLFCHSFCMRCAISPMALLPLPSLLTCKTHAQNILVYKLHRKNPMGASVVGHKMGQFQKLATNKITRKLAVSFEALTVRWCTLQIISIASIIFCYGKSVRPPATYAKCAITKKFKTVH